MNLTALWADVVAFWADYSTPIVTGTGAALALVVVVLLWRFFRTADRSKVVSTVAAVVVMAWTSEGLLAVALRKFHLPVGFAVMTFFVFEAMMVAAALKAEEHRAAKGVPGHAGGYVFVLAGFSGLISAFGAHNAGEVVLRIILPSLAVGLWWIFLVAERDGDKPEWKAVREAERQARAERNDATWAVTPRTVLVRLGLMKPGQQSVTQAQREYRIKRMTAFGCTLYDWAWWLPPYWWAWWRLRRMARNADRAMVREVRRRVRRATRAVDLVVPSKRNTPVEVPVDVPVEVPADVPPEADTDVPVEGSAPAIPDVPPASQTGTSGDEPGRKSTGTRGGTSARKAGRKVPVAKAQRSSEETRKLALDLLAKVPAPTKTAVAAELGITDRRLRDVLNQPAKANGHAPDINLAGVTS